MVGTQTSFPVTTGALDRQEADLRKTVRNQDREIMLSRPRDSSLWCRLGMYSFTNSPNTPETNHCMWCLLAIYFLRYTFFKLYMSLILHSLTLLKKKSFLHDVSWECTHSQTLKKKLRKKKKENKKTIVYDVIWGCTPYQTLLKPPIVHDVINCSDTLIHQLTKHSWNKPLYVMPDGDVLLNKHSKNNLLNIMSIENVLLNEHS